MNIFILDPEPRLAAQYHCNKHVVKMIVETGQMLSSAHRTHGVVTDKYLYRVPNANHPCTKWVVESEDNYEWLFELFVYLSLEYKKRYGKEHGSWKVLNGVLRETPENLESVGLTKFVLAMPDEYKQNDAVEAYRNFYIGEKLRFAVWPKVPDWVIEKVREKKKSIKIIGRGY